MRLFQNSGLYPSYLARLNQLAPRRSSFEERRRIFLDDRFGALHFLKPVLIDDPRRSSPMAMTKSCSAIGRASRGCGKPTLEAILLAQIEHHRTEVFYNLDPVRYPSAFVRKLPGCVRKTFCWRAAPSGNADLTAYGAVLGNFPSILESWRRRGCRAELFFPAIDPSMRSMDTTIGRSTCFLLAAIRDIIPRARRCSNRSRASPKRSRCFIASMLRG